ncbi:MAG: ABC transporter permease [Anaerolineales bacterium]
MSATWEALRRGVIVLLPLLGGIVVAMILINLVLRAEGVTLQEVWDALYSGAWERSSSRARVMRNLLPLLLCSAGLLITFSSGLWNIGIEGQLTMGAVGASLGALFWELPNRELQLFAQMGTAVVAGGAWALLAGILRTRGGVNEIFGGVALNFIAQLFSAYLLAGPWSPPTGGTGSRTLPFDQEKLLPAAIVERAFVSYEAIAIAVVGFLLVAYILYFTRFGLQLKAIGRSMASAEALGIPVERNIWLSMALCGALSGLGGAIIVLHPPTGQLQANASGGIGFLALLVVLLASIRPWLVPIIAFAFAFLNTGAQRVESSLRLDSSLVNVLQGVLVLAVLLFDGVRQQIEHQQERRRVAAQSASMAEDQQL